MNGPDLLPLLFRQARLPQVVAHLSDRVSHAELVVEGLSMSAFLIALSAPDTKATALVLTCSAVSLQLLFTVSPSRFFSPVFRSFPTTTFTSFFFPTPWALVPSA